MILAILLGAAIVATAAAAVDTDDLPENVAFSAVFQENVNIGSGEVVKYPVVYTNHGTNYDNTTGVFKAKNKGGLYVFHISAQAQPGDDFSLTLYFNDKPIITAAGKTEGNNRGSGSNSVTLRVVRNDRVYVKADIGSSLRGDKDSVYNSFNGYLIGALTSSN